MKIRVHTDVERFTKGMDELAKRQIPFALARALTMTAKDAQADVRADLPNRFTIRRPFVPNSVRITPATKSRPEAVVGVGQLASFMARQEQGGTKTAAGHRVAVPVKVKRSKRDLITAANLPRAVRSKPRSFMLAKGSGAGIMRRVGRDRYPIEIVYWLKRGVQIKPTFGFKGTTSDSVGSHFGPNFVESLSKAMGHTG
jgi:hypothetical protein